MTTTIPKIRYDVPFEVTKKQYDALRNECRGVLCHRVDNEGKYWIKVWLMNDVADVKQVLKENK